MDYISNNYCRVCLEDLKEDRQLSLEDSFGGIVLYTALEILTDTKDIRTDPFTKKICTKCAEQVKMAQGVRQKAMAAAEALKKSLKVKDNETYDEEYLQDNNGVAGDKSEFIEEFLDEDIIYEPMDEDAQSDFLKDDDDDDEEEPFFEIEPPKPDPNSGDSDDNYDDELMPEADIAAENLHFCCKCTEVFVDEEELVIHFAKEHKQFLPAENKRISNSKKANKIECTLCGTWTKHLQKHRALHHLLGPVKYTCKDCGKSFRDIKGRKKCEAKHAGIVDMRLQCPKCPRILSSSRSLYNHLKAHDKPKVEGNARKRACTICGILVNTSYLSIHNRIHTGERPFKCNYCEKTFIHNTDHKRHEMMHTGVRPYKCMAPNCGAGFVKKSYLNLHIEKRHPERIVL